MASAAVLERRIQAVALVQSGHSYDDIAVELGYANRSGAWKAVQAALGSHESESVEQLRALEVDRLDALQASLWPRLREGDVAVANTILRIIVTRVRLLGLEPSRKPGRKPDGHTSLVDPAYWEHVKAVHPGSVECTCC